jgi:hypothetical protein
MAVSHGGLGLTGSQGKAERCKYGSDFSAIITRNQGITKFAACLADVYIGSDEMLACQNTKHKLTIM